MFLNTCLFYITVKYIFKIILYINITHLCVLSGVKMLLDFFFFYQILQTYMVPFNKILCNLFYSSIRKHCCTDSSPSQKR